MTSHIALLLVFSVGQPQIPLGPQPKFAMVRSIDKESGEVTLAQFQTVAELVEEKAIVNGQQVTRRAVHQVLRTVETRFSIEKGAVMDTTGKKVPAAEVWKQLRVGATILVAPQQPDALYLRVVQPGTLIFIVSPSPGPFPKLPPPKV